MSRLTASADSQGLQTLAASHVLPAGSVYGLVTAAEAQAIVSAVRRSNDPGSQVPDVPWAAIVERRPGEYAATASTMLPSGLCWSLGTEQLTVSTDAGGVVAALERPPRLDHEFLRRFTVCEVPVAGTPFVGVQRIRGGTTLTWSHGDRTPALHQWCGEQTWPHQPVRGDVGVAEYRRTFLEVVTDLTPRTPSVVAAVSGGLDSTFMVAALAQSGVETVLGLTAVPLSAAHLEPVGPLDPDESALADLLQRQYPDQVLIRHVRNEVRTDPLTAARHRTATSWWPVFNPANAPWLAQLEGLSAGAGATMLLTGTHGNAAFSWTHPGTRRPRNPLRVLRTNRRRPIGSHPAGTIGAPYRPPLPGRGRATYLRWLGATDNGLTAALTPGEAGGVLRVDPFRSRKILDLAARIHPDEWRVEGLPRGFARRAGAGWVPDPIRLRTRRGAQGWDSWFVMRDDRADVLTAVDRLADIPALTVWVDIGSVRRTVAGWPWGQTGPPPPGFGAILRVLALSNYIEDVSERIAAAPRLPAASGRKLVRAETRSDSR